MFPELYCRRCDGGRGPLCDACLLEEEAMDEAYGEDYTNRDFDHEAAIDRDFYSGEGTL